MKWHYEGPLKMVPIRVWGRKGDVFSPAELLGWSASIQDKEGHHITYGLNGRIFSTVEKLEEAWGDKPKTFEVDDPFVSGWELPPEAKEWACCPGPYEGHAISMNVEVE